MKYLEESQRKFLKERKEERRFEVGDQVLLKYKMEKHKKKTMGKAYYPYSGEIVEVLRNGKYYKVRWGKSSPPKERTGEVSKKQFRWDQIILRNDGESEELIVQFFNQADGYNTAELPKKLKNMKRMWRQRKNARGELEVLCSYNKKGEPEWEKIYDVGSTRMYKEFVEGYWKEREKIMERKQRREERKEKFRVEHFFCAKEEGKKVLVLWKYWEEPTWEEVDNVESLRMYQKWKKSRRYLELEEKESEEESE